MAFLDEHGRTARVFYNNIVYLSMLLLGVLVLASLNASVGDGDDAVARYTECALEMSANVAARLKEAKDDIDPVCVKFFSEGDVTAEDQEHQLLQLFNISVSIVVINILCFVWSVATHWGYGIETHFMVQWSLSAINLGLFSGLVGWYNASENLSVDVNLEHNVYFSDFNPYAVAIVGVVAGVLDLVLFNALKLGYFKARCDSGPMPQN